MLQADINKLQADPTYSVEASNGVYIVFMVIGIIGYFTIPTVANWIIMAGGMGNYGKNVAHRQVKPVLWLQVQSVRQQVIYQANY